MNDVEIQEIIQSSDLPVVLDFWADWCVSCKKLAPSISELEEEWIGTAVVLKVNVDEAIETSLKYKVMGLPSVYLVKDGKVETQLTGTLTKSSIKESLEQLF